MVCLQEARELFKDPEVEAADKVEVGCKTANTKICESKLLTK